MSCGHIIIYYVSHIVRYLIHFYLLKIMLEKETHMSVLIFTCSEVELSQQKECVVYRLVRRR